MLKITIPAIELYDEANEEFVTSKGQTLQLEHSLVSLSKWESKWNKPFLTSENKTHEETIDYLKCMTITQNIDEKIYSYVTDQNITDVTNYIDSPMTATKILNRKSEIQNRETITAEIIYYWMISLNIPFECQKWHLNKLLTLINVCNIKNNPPKKMSHREILERNRTLNESRKKALGTKG